MSLGRLNLGPAVWRVVDIPDALLLEKFLSLFGHEHPLLLVQTHQTTRHISYSGPMVELTEALTSLPSGGQCIMSGQTYQRAFPQLQGLAEDPFRKVEAGPQLQPSEETLLCRVPSLSGH